VRRGGAYLELVLGRVDGVEAVGVEAVNWLGLLPVDLKAAFLREGGREGGE